MINWKEENHKLSKTFSFKTFGEAMAWMVKASFEIETAGVRRVSARTYETHTNGGSGFCAKES